MQSVFRYTGGRLGVIVGILTTSAWQASLLAGQLPTMSLEAVAVNGRSLGDEPTALVAAFPGDIVTAEVYIRDWSIDGEGLSGYQAALLPVSFSSGEIGFIEPVNYEASQKSGEENYTNSFVDENHPRYVHKSFKTLALADTRSEGYRWMSAVLQGKPPISQQDGRKYYGATIKLEVSSNARGNFSIELDSHPDFSGLRNNIASPIKTIKFEGLTISVFPDPVRVVDGLNRTGDLPDAQVDVNHDGTRNSRDVLSSIEALNVYP